MTKYPNINPKSIPSFPTKYTSRDWQCALTAKFAGSVPHILLSMFTIPDDPEELPKKRIAPNKFIPPYTRNWL